MAMKSDVARQRLTALTDRTDELSSAWGPAVLRWTAALLWLSNLSWKVPTAFGKSAESCRGLCGYVAKGAESRVVPGSPWFFENLVAPNLGVFGWITLFSEAALVALLMSGRYLRFAAVLGIVQAAGIGLAVANAEGEWYWSYLLMMALHVAILVLAPGTQPARRAAFGWVLAGYGALVALGHITAPFAGDSNDTWWGPFAESNDVPGDFARNVFPGSILLGLILIAMGVGMALLIPKLDEAVLVPAGWVVVGLSAVLMLTYRSDGLIIGLGSKASTLAVLAAAGLVMVGGSTRSTSESAGGPGRSTRA